MIDYLVNKSNTRVQTVALSVVSMMASSERGVDYLTRSTDSIRKFCEIVFNVPEMSVAHRFGVAILYKLSCHKDLAKDLLENKVDNYILDFMSGYNSTICHSYFPIFYMALSFNLLTSQFSRDKISRFINRYGPFCQKLLSFFKKDLPSAAHQTILETFKYLLYDKEIYYRDLMVECRAVDVLREYYSSVESLFKNRKHILDVHREKFSLTIKEALSQKPELSQKEQLEQRKRERELEEHQERNKDKLRKVLDFESFKDEIMEDALVS